jgi:Protein of unknown function (DUF3176)
MFFSRARPPVEPRLSSRHATRDGWLMEFVALHTSLACTVVAAVILFRYNHHQVFDWNGLTLNAILSTLSTASKALLIFAVAETISQYKWIMFSRPKHKLGEFEVVDNASRGPLGCMQLLWRRKVR